LLIENIDQDLEEQIFQFVSNSLKLDDFKVQTLAGDASNRRYFRIISQENSWVLMSWEPFVDDKKYAFLSVLNHFASHNVHVPEVISKAPELGFILLEDLGDLTLERKYWENQNQNQLLSFYDQAIDELIKIHYQCSQVRNDCTAFKVEFDTEKFMWEFNYGKTHLFEKALGLHLSDSDTKKLDDIFLDISEALNQEEKFISHRDYHSRNLMIKLGKMRVIDFQDARLGPIQYDLVSLVHDSYVNIQPEFEKIILNSYINKANDVRAKKIDPEAFNEIFLLQKIQRCFKACGSFSSFLNLRDDKRYLKYLGPTLKKVCATIDEFPQYEFLKTLIVSNGLLEKDFSKL
jgi:aminoglycoside/choline kinase family phosphotransferase